MEADGGGGRPLFYIFGSFSRSPPATKAITGGARRAVRVVMALINATALTGGARDDYNL